MGISKVDFVNAASLDRVEEELGANRLKSAQSILSTVQTQDPMVLARIGRAEVDIREKRIAGVVQSTLTGEPDAKRQVEQLRNDYTLTQKNLRELLAAEEGLEIEAEEADPESADAQMEMAEMAEFFYKGNHKKGFALFNRLPLEMKEGLNRHLDDLGASLFALGDHTEVPRAIWGFLNELSYSGLGTPSEEEIHQIFAEADAAAEGP